MQNTRDENIARVAELAKDIRMAMLVTRDNHGNMRSRPMATQESTFDGTLWFFTDEHSSKVEEIAADPHVCVAYAQSMSESYLSVSGTAAVINDRAKAQELWSPFLRAWFTGWDDPTLRLIRVDADEAEYWDSKGGKLASMIMVLRAAITGKQDTEMNNDHQKVTL